MAPPTIIGIDLGTSNSALAYARGDGFEVLGVPQLDAPAAVGRHVTLPSALYIPHPGEISAAESRLPWQSEGVTDAIIGRYARERGTQVPERLVLSAKSWLCNQHVNRHEALLPWRSPVESGKRSPVDASRLYLSHLKAAYEHAAASAGQAVDLSQHDVVLTVPASFDEVARNLTHEAAIAAGLTRVTLLEEPLAAFYAWIAASGDDWRHHVVPGDVVLVCDVGGGTTDFSLIHVSEEKKDLALERIAVGDHLLLGGDNMDLALAYALKARLEGAGKTLDHWQFLALVGAARAAKEVLLSPGAPDALPVSIAGRGSSLFAQTISTELDLGLVEQVLVDGFFPLTSPEDMPATKRMSGIQEFGLSFETDPGVSRHLARFLKRSAQGLAANPHAAPALRDRKDLRPNKVLFNGGVFKANALRQRVLQLLGSWTGAAVEELSGTHLDLAVAYGAAYYGKMRATGKGIRVVSGTARSYYVGLESPMPAVPGIEPPVRGLCLVPQGTEEGTELTLPDRQFGLVVGEEVEFRFFSSAVRGGDVLGTTVDDAPRELDESMRLSLTLPPGDAQGGDILPVRLDAVVTEVGTLQLYLKHVASDRKWNLEFNVRKHDHA